MTPRPLGKLRWWDHWAALWWLGLLYRRPHKFREALEQLSRGQAVLSGLLVLGHALPYLLITAGLFRWVLSGLLNLPLRESPAADTSVLLAHAATLLKGIAVGIALGIAGGIAGGIAFGIALGIASGIALGIAFGIASGIAVGIASGIAGGIAFGIASVRAYYQPLHVWFVWPAVQARWYSFHPVAWDDLCSLPFPGLHRLLVAYAELSPDAGNAEIERLISSYPSQRTQALRARTTLIARAAGAEPNLSRIDAIIADLPQGDKNFLTQTPEVRKMVGEIAAEQRRLDAINQAVLRQPYAELVASKIESFRGRLAGFQEPLASEFRAAADKWLVIAQRQLAEVQSITGKEPTPQLFRAGDPVDRTREAFVPRMTVLGQLERQVMLATGCPGLLIYGRRRMGKSTLLRNLRGFLPWSVRIVSISMQNPAAFTSVSSLSRLIMDEVLKIYAARNVPRSYDLSGLFQLLDENNTDLEEEEKQMILAFDEFEQFDVKIGEGAFNLDLLATIRESVQMHRHLIWLFAGSHHITELTHAPWDSYFVSLRTIEVPPFSEAETRLLLTEPLKESPLYERDDARRPRYGAAFWGDGGIEWIHEQTAGWPHLVQLLAGAAVDLINESDVAALNRSMLQKAADRSIVEGDTVLRQLMRGESELPGEWDYLAGFRTHDEQAAPADEAVFQSLRHRQLVFEDGGLWRLRVPLMQRWLRARG